MVSLYTVDQEPSFEPSHPGELLREDIMEPRGLSASQLAKLLCVHKATVSRLIKQDAPGALSPEMALRLEACLGIAAASLLAMQAKYDLWHARQQVNLDGIEGIQIPETYKGLTSANPLT